MATKTNCLFAICYIFLTTVASVFSFLNFEELKSIHYGIDILSKPVLQGEELPSGSVQLTSKYGQQYQCLIPDQVEQERQQEERERVAMKTGVVELLKPMESSSCLIKTRDWWSYEFCYGKYVRQFHLEDGRINSDIMIIGNYESDFDWSNETLRDQKLKSKNALNRYHSQKYTNGSKCDLTGGLRAAEVRFVCEDTASDYISRIDEPQTCIYIITINTNKICNHPYLKPPAPKIPVPITCNPLLNQEDYNDYLIELQEEEKAKEEEEIRQRLAAVEAEHKARQNQDNNDGTVVNMEQDNLNNNIEESLHNILDKQISKITDKVGGEASESTMTIKYLDNMDDLESALREQITEAQKHKLNLNKIPTNKDKDKNVINKNNASPEETKRTASMNTVDKKTDRTADASAVDDGAEDDSKANSDAIDDSKADGSAADDSAANTDKVDEGIMKDFDKEISDVKKQLKAKRDKFANMKNKIGDSVRSQFDDIVNEAEQEVGVAADKKEAFQQLSKTLNNLLNRLEKTEEEIDGVDKEIGDLNQKLTSQETTDNQETKHTQDTKGDKLMADAKKLQEKVKKLKDTEILTKDLVNSGELKKIEAKVKESLEKAGIETSGGKVQVKIITAGYYDPDSDSLHLLSENDASLSSVVISLMNGGNDAIKEEAKFQSLEKNYGRVWVKSKKTKKKP